MNQDSSPKSKLMISRSPGDLLIFFPNRVSHFKVGLLILLAAVLFLTCIMWWVAGISSLNMDVIPFGKFILIVFIFIVWLSWSVAGREVVVVNSTSLIRRFEILGLGMYSREFQRSLV